MTEDSRDIDLVNFLCSCQAETPWLEFKHNNEAPKTIGRSVSALSNSARLTDRENAYLVWGVEDGSHRIVGTRFNPETKRTGNQDFQLWLAQRLQPSLALQFRRVDHPDGRLVLLEIPAATRTATAFAGVAYIRVGDATIKLYDDSQRHELLYEKLRSSSWELGIAASHMSSDEVLNLIDWDGYFKQTGQPRPDISKGMPESLIADRLIEPELGGRWNITNLGAVLFAINLSQFDLSLARKAIRFARYGGASRLKPVTHSWDETKGFAVCFEGAVARISELIPKSEHLNGVVREDRPMIPIAAIREVLVNALVHQDMRVTGAGPLVELFDNRIEITNPGTPLVPIDRMIDQPPTSRNEGMASLMRRMGFCEERGTGLDIVLGLAESYQLPPPLLESAGTSMRVTLYGPRKLAMMHTDERIRACYHHAVLQYIQGRRMQNSTLCARLGIDRKRNAALASRVIKQTLEAGLIKYADKAHPRTGYVPTWA